MKITLMVLGSAVILAVLGSLWFLNACEDDWCAVFGWQKARLVTDFESCARLGFGIMESYPAQCAVDGKTYTQDIGNELEKTDLIRVTRPRPGDVVASPLIIEGEARGYWFFEASFPVRILDANGTELGVVPAQALEPWMTTAFVPFRATLLFKAPATKRGTLIFQKDNPSGLPEHDDALRMPIRFGEQPGADATPMPSDEMMTVKIFFLPGGENPDREPDCSTVFPVSRSISKTPAVARAALEELLKGPTAEETSRQGVTTAIRQGVHIRSLAITNGIAYVDFDRALEPGGGSCAVIAIRSQITETLKQFPTIQSVVLSVEGQTEGILQP